MSITGWQAGRGWRKLIIDLKDRDVLSARRHIQEVKEFCQTLPGHVAVHVMDYKTLALVAFANERDAVHFRLRFECRLPSRTKVIEARRGKRRAARR